MSQFRECRNWCLDVGHKGGDQRNYVARGSSAAEVIQRRCYCWLNRGHSVRRSVAPNAFGVAHCLLASREFAITACACDASRHYFYPLQPTLKLRLASKRGCSSVVEHLLAKEDVASSSLVTRSSLRLEQSEWRRLERPP